MGNNISSVPGSSGSAWQQQQQQQLRGGNDYCNSLPGSPMHKGSASVPSTPPTASRAATSAHLQSSSRPSTPREGSSGSCGIGSRHFPAQQLTIPPLQLQGSSTAAGAASAGLSLGVALGMPTAGAGRAATTADSGPVVANGFWGDSLNNCRQPLSSGGDSGFGSGSIGAHVGKTGGNFASGSACLDVGHHPVTYQLPDTPGSVSHHDIFISYRHSDTSVMTKLKDVLHKNGFRVWVDEFSIDVGENFISKIGEGICGSKIFMCVVTEGTYQSRYCVDELCLAYIKEKPIYAVSLCTQQDMFRRFPTSIKLIVSRFDWTTVSEENFQNDIETVLIGKLKAELEGGSPGDLSPSPITPPYTGKFQRKQVVKKPHSRSRVYSRVFNRSISRGNSIVDHAEDIDCGQEFWERNFHDQEKVSWQRFEEAFLHDYNEQLKMTYESSDKAWFTVILKRELGVEDDMVSLDKFREFTDDESNDRSILACVNDLCRENLAMREVFSLDSTVRISAINDLATCHSPAVVEALLDLLNEPEHDVRASACLSLAKVKGGYETMRIDRLSRCLRDSDRFVRQAACAALGYLKAHTAVDDLLRLWRNDPVTDVRQEAENALRYIGGEKVDKRFQMTTALINEIQELTKLLEGPANGTPQSKHHPAKANSASGAHSKPRLDLDEKAKTLPKGFPKVAAGSSDV